MRRPKKTPWEQHLERESRRRVVQGFDITTADVAEIVDAGEFDEWWEDLGRVVRTLAICRSNRKWSNTWGPLMDEFFRALAPTPNPVAPSS